MRCMCSWPRSFPSSQAEWRGTVTCSASFLEVLVLSARALGSGPSLLFCDDDDHLAVETWGGGGTPPHAYAGILVEIEETILLFAAGGGDFSDDPAGDDDDGGKKMRSLVLKHGPEWKSTRSTPAMTDMINSPSFRLSAKQRTWAKFRAWPLLQRLWTRCVVCL